jgi:hypothetical protein
MLFIMRLIQARAGFNGGYNGEYSSLEEVKNSFAALDFASGIDPNGWAVSPEIAWPS